MSHGEVCWTCRKYVGAEEWHCKCAPPFEPPDPAMVERIDKALQRHLAERNKRDHEYEEKAAERVLERLWDRQ